MRSISVVVEVLVVIIALTFSTEASDPSPLQDFCVTTNDTRHGVYVNGEYCKDPARTTSDDFYYSGFNIPANTSNHYGKKSTVLTAKELPGLNTAGIALSRVDFAPKGVNPPHHHPRSAELLMVMKGTLIAGFITSNPDHRHFSKILKPGDVFVVPHGLLHFQYNIGETDALAFSAFSSQNPGTITETNTLFDANPQIMPDLLAKSFQLDEEIIRELQSKYWVNP